MTRYTAPTEAEITAIQRHAHRMRSEAMRAAGASFMAWLRGLVGAGAGVAAPKGGRTA